MGRPGRIWLVASAADNGRNPETMGSTSEPPLWSLQPCDRVLAEVISFRLSSGRPTTYSLERASTSCVRKSLRLRPPNLELPGRRQHDAWEQPFGRLATCGAHVRSTAQLSLTSLNHLGRARARRRPGTTNPAYAGALAVNGIKGFNAIGGKGVRVPVEGDGGPGTALAHWHETTFKNELMTGFLSGQAQPLSAMTVNSLIDLGYQVNKNSAETFTMPDATAPGRLLDEEHEHEHERVLAEGGWEEPTWPDISKEAAFLGEDGVYVAKTSQVEAEIQASIQASSATDSYAGSSTGAIVGAAAGGALAMLAVVAVAANYRAVKASRGVRRAAPLFSTTSCSRLALCEPRALSRRRARCGRAVSAAAGANRRASGLSESSPLCCRRVVLLVQERRPR
jgi:hypothetical protein